MMVLHYHAAHTMVASHKVCLYHRHHHHQHRRRRWPVGAHGKYDSPHQCKVSFSSSAGFIHVSRYGHQEFTKTTLPPVCSPRPPFGRLKLVPKRSCCVCVCVDLANNCPATDKAHEAKKPTHFDPHSTSTCSRERRCIMSPRAVVVVGLTKCLSMRV